jgi:hypothetical protein
LNLTAMRLLALAALTSAAPIAQGVGIDYAQVDTASNATSGVVVSALGPTDTATPPPLASATYARWSNGEAASIGYVYRWALPGEDHRWFLGAGIGANSFRNRASSTDRDDAAVSARLQSEWLGPAPGGNYYALVQAASFRRTWLATAQYPFSWVPVAPEWTRYHERGYQSTSLGLRISVGVPRWFVRVGVIRAEGESRPYIGVAYNGF